MPIIRYVADLLGLLMNGIYYVISQIGLPNVSIAIILFTIILLVAMTPLQVKQQRFSKLNTIMQPELKKIQKKYEGKKDQVSQQRMMEETQAVYQKYGVSTAGSCVQMLIQLPVLFALYQVIYKIPGYITIIGNKIATIASDATFVKAFSSFVKATNNSTLTRNFAKGGTKNVIDAVYGMNTDQWAAVLKKASGTAYEAKLTDIHSYVHRATYFLGLNISDSPWDIIRYAMRHGAVLMIIAAIAFPVLAWFTQWLTFKLMPNQTPSSDENDTSAQMANTMNSMNNFMPIISAVFCLTLPVGVGIYWIMSAVVRAIQQVIINKKLDSESVEDIVKKAEEKQAKKRAKKGVPAREVTTAAHVSTRTLAADAKAKTEARNRRLDQNKKKMEESTEYYNKNAKPGSLASKANMVAAFDEKNKKKRTDYKK